ncbi:TPA: hypothetical protein VNE75_000694 [Streptococcus pyogenes]|nr:hypothetical protein [Streptococcus pyogenes]KGE60957.1 hypothetical protein MGAS2111_0496 [Streptococcus pyogenes MGAS2111]HER5242736.1 hypothetical protein [Streptococcus pyogenes MGAS10006]HER5295231.1 hypothetical protein [Streptococcus pyogenes MGAS15188]SDV81759.1 hypothetical protein ISR1_0328 [Streptococcus pyogenes]BAU61029.1 hypothetical protein M3B_1664 [Streptococcus pyogenes]
MWLGNGATILGRGRQFFSSQLLAVAILPLQAVWASGRVLRLPILLVAF